jgi:hypothetical protein
MPNSARLVRTRLLYSKMTSWTAGLPSPTHNMLAKRQFWARAKLPFGQISEIFYKKVPQFLS